MRPSLTVSTLALLAAASLSAQIALDTAPPRVETFVPTVADAASPGPTWVAAEDPTGPDGISLRRARLGGDAVDGALRVDPPLTLLLPGDGGEDLAPPTPRFAVTRVMVAKFEILGRVFETGVLEARITVDRRGRVSSIDARDRRVVDLVQGFFDDLPGKTPFAPATRGGKAIESTLSFRWDLRLERPPAFPPQAPGTATACTLPESGANAPARVRLYAWGGPVTEVTGVALAAPTTLEPAISAALLRYATTVPWGTDNPATIEEWTWEIDREARVARLAARRPVRQLDPVMRHAPRPEYPQKLWRRGPEGFAYLKFEIDATGSTRALEVLEATEKAFGSAALEAVAQWEFEPMRLDGEAIASEVIMTLPFRLPPRR